MTASASPQPESGGAGRPWIACALIVLTALGVRCISLVESTDGPLMRDSLPMFDSQYYDQEARRIAEGDLLGDEVFFMAPLYPYALSVPYRLTRRTAPGGGHVYDIVAIRYLQCLLGALCCGLIFWIARLTVGGAAAPLAGMIAALYGVFIYYDGLIMPTSLNLFVNLAAILALILARRRRSLRWWLASGLLIGLAAIAHGTALTTLVLVLIWIAFSDRGGPRRVRWTRWALVAAGAGLMIGLVTARNWAVGHDLVLLTSNAGKNLYVGNSPTATGTYDDHVSYEYPDLWGSHLSHYMGGRSRTAADPAPSEMSRFLAARSLEFMRDEPVRELGLLIRKFRLYFNRFELGINDNIAFAGRYSSMLRLTPIGFGLVATLGLAGMVLLLRERRADPVLLLFAAAQVASFTLMFVLGRFRLVFAAIMIVFAAHFLVRVFTAWRGGGVRAVWRMAIPLLVAALWVHWPVSGLEPERGFGQQYLAAGANDLEHGRLREARFSFEAGTRADFRPWADPAPMRARCHLNLGVIQERTGERAAAIASYRAALRVIGAARSPGVAMRDWLEKRIRMLENDIGR